ncbi:MAG TPA: hypothetical protein GX697_04575 [Firmicutes bacterium]|nr:hypothetical protein [Bacillota bacterium]
MKKNSKKILPYKWAAIVTLWTFLLAVFFSLFSQYVVTNLHSVVVSFLILLIIIFTGIVFDIIGIAATAADEAPFHAKAAKKVTGAKEAIYFVRNAGIVSNFSNDVIGDICGIISGSVGALIVFHLSRLYPGFNIALLSILLTAGIAALTVGGKALGKSMAISRSTEIILLVSKTLYRLKNLFRLKASRNSRR